jgi:hypothetical protein
MTDEEKKKMQEQALQAGVVIGGGVVAATAGVLLKEMLDRRREANKPIGGVVVADSTDLNTLAKVCLFQPDSGFEATVLLDDLPLAKIDGRQYLVTWVKPGRHVFLSEHKEQYVEANFAVGNSYYLMLEPSFWMGKMQVMLSNSEKWRKVVDKLNPVKAKQMIERAGTTLLAKLV